MKFTGDHVFQMIDAAKTLVIPGQTDSCDALAVVISRAIQKWLDEAPVVYANQEGEPQICGHIHTVWHECKTRPDTHTARLVQIEELK